MITETAIGAEASPDTSGDCTPLKQPWETPRVVSSAIKDVTAASDDIVFVS